MITFNTNATEAVKKAAMKLAIRYKSITVEKINAVNNGDIFSVYNVATKLTGFGKLSSCTLCKTAIYCSSCIYKQKKSGKFSCLSGSNEKTYYAIKLAKTPEQLVKAFKRRAEHIEKILALIEKNPEKTQ